MLFPNLKYIEFVQDWNTVNCSKIVEATIFILIKKTGKYKDISILIKKVVLGYIIESAGT